MLVLIVAFGCHVFETVEVRCTSDMPCAADEPADADTDVDTDTDTDTDVETGEVRAPSVGWAVSLTANDIGRVRVYQPDGARMIAEWSAFGAAHGPVAYDAATGTAAVSDGTTVLLLADGGGYATAADTLAGTGTDLVLHDGAAWLPVGTALAAVDLETLAVDYAFEDQGVTELASADAGADGLYLADVDGGRPDLWRYTPGGTPEALYVDFDDTASRGRNVFIGPDGEPCTCTAAGAVYRVADLGGGAAPVLYYDGGLSDVTDCAWDPRDGTWLLFSPTAGVLRVDEQGRADVVFTPPNGYTLARAGFYTE